MIRPLTCLAFLFACGSGLYLYQSKHQASVLDAQIAQTVRSTDALREQTRMLSAEWTLLNDPERLRQLSTQFLTLQTVSPNQFTSLGDLDARLPAPVPPGAPGNDDITAPANQAGVPMASNGSSRMGTDEGKPASANPTDAKLVETPSPAPPKVAATSGASPQSARVASAATAEQSHPAESKPAAARVAIASVQPRLVASQPRPTEPRGPEQHGTGQQGFTQRVAEARPIAAPPRIPAPQPMQPTGGSLLGMAHSATSSPVPMPLPRPMPVNAPSWSYSNGG